MKNPLLIIVFGLISVLGISQTTPETPLEFVQEMPTYPGGQDAMFEVIFDHLVYPEYEKSMNIEGTVLIQFIIEKDGTPTNFKVFRGVADGSGLDSAALKACKQLGKFNPGKQDGIPQRVYSGMPIKFSLADDGDTGLTKKEMKEIEKDAKFICEMIYKLVELQLAGDTIEVDALNKSFEPKMVELQKKYPKGSALEKKLEEFVKPCLEEAKNRFPMVQSQVQEDEKLTGREIKRIKKDAKYMCDMILKIMDAERSGDEIKSKSLSDEFEKQAGTFQKNYPKGGLKEKELEKLVRPCLEEAMKDALRKSLRD